MLYKFKLGEVVCTLPNSPRNPTHSLRASARKAHCGFRGGRRSSVEQIPRVLTLLSLGRKAKSARAF